MSDWDLDELFAPLAPQPPADVLESSNPSKGSNREVEILLRSLGREEKPVEAQTSFLGAEATERLFVSSRRRLAFVEQIKQKLLSYKVSDDEHDADPASRAARAEAELKKLFSDSAATARQKSSPYDLIQQILKEREKEDEQDKAAAAPVARSEPRNSAAPVDPLSYLLTQQTKTSKPIVSSTYGPRLMEAPQRSASEHHLPARPATRQQSSRNDGGQPQYVALRFDAPDDESVIERIRIQHSKHPLPVKFSWLTIDEHRHYLQLLSKPMHTHNAKDRRLVAAVEAERERYNQTLRQRVEQCRDLYQCYLRDIRSFVDGFWMENQRGDIVKNYRQNWIRDAPEDLFVSIPQEVFNRVQSLQKDGQPPAEPLVVAPDSKLESTLTQLVPLYASPDPLKVDLLAQKLKEIHAARPRRVPLMIDAAALQHPAVVSGEVDVIISASALDSLISAAPAPMFNTWQLPYAFFEAALSPPASSATEEGEIGGLKRKRVLVIDKPFLPAECTPRAKNEIFFKRALKLMTYEDEQDERRYQKLYTKVRIADYVLLVRHRAAGLMPGAAPDSPPSEESPSSSSAGSPPRIIAAIHASMTYLSDGAKEMTDPSDSARLWMRRQLCLKKEGNDDASAMAPQTCILNATIDPFERTITNVEYTAFEDVPPEAIVNWTAFLQTIFGRMMSRLPDDTNASTSSTQVAVAACHPFRGLISHRIDSETVRPFVEFFHQASAAEDQSMASSSSRLVFFDVWTAQQNAGRTKMDPITWARAPAWNSNRLGHIPGVFPPLLNHPSNHTADKFCFSFASTGVCARGHDCLFPHLDQREADEAKRSFGSVPNAAAGSSGTPIAPMSALGRELINLKKKFDAQWAQSTKASGNLPPAGGSKKQNQKQNKKQQQQAKKKSRKTKRGPKQTSAADADDGEQGGNENVSHDDDHGANNSIEEPATKRQKLDDGEDVDAATTSNASS